MRGLYVEASFARAVPESENLLGDCRWRGDVENKVGGVENKVGGVDGERWVLSLSVEISVRSGSQYELRFLDRSGSYLRCYSKPSSSGSM